MDDDLTPKRAAAALDFTSYDLDELRDDVRSVVDVGGAISAVTRWAIGAAAVAAIVSWIIFQSRIDSGAIAIIFALVAGVCAIPLGAAVGGWLLARRRLNIVTEASGRVVDVVGQMHGDVLQLRAGTAETSVQQVAVSLLQEAVFPAVFGTVNSTAEGLLGPLSFIAGRVTKAPMKVVEHSVVAAIEALPDRQIGELVDGAVGALHVDDAVRGVNDHYVQVRGDLTSIVAKVSRTSLIVALTLLMAASMPLIIWLLIGWVAS